MRYNRTYLRVLYLASIPIVCAQLYPQTGNWRDPAITLDFATRDTLTESTLQVLARQINFTSGTSSSLAIEQNAAQLLTMAEYDRRTANTIFQDNVTTALKNLELAKNWSSTSWQFNSNRLRWGLAYFAAYQAYSDSPAQHFFLSSAQDCWAAAQVYFVTPTTALNGSSAGLPPFTPPIQSTCSPLTGGTRATVAGAALWFNNPTINGETIGPWIILSSLLYTSSLNSTYSDAAALSIQFVKNFLSNGTMIFDTYDVQKCSLSFAGTFTYNAGYFLWGVSIYYTNVTSAAEQELSDLNELVASLILFQGWTRRDGLIYEDQITSTTSDLGNEQLGADWKAIFVTGLQSCLAAGLLNTTVANLTEQYIAVQFNAVRELANYSTSGISEQVYGPSWIGTPTPLQQYLAYGQLSAAELFTAALRVGSVNGTSSTGSSSSATSTATSVAQSSSFRRNINVGSIVGGTIGGGAAVLGILVGILCWRRRRRISPSGPGLLERSSMMPDPYTATMQEYPDYGRSTMLVQAADSPVRMTKLQPMRYIQTVSGQSAPAASQSLHASSPSSEEHMHQGRAGIVTVDAGALNRLLMGIGGALSDLQRRRYGEGSRGLEPPDYEDST